MTTTRALDALTSFEGDCAPCKQRAASTRTDNPDNAFSAPAAPDPSTDTPPAEPSTPAAAATWRGVIGMEGTMTGDGRIIEKNALTWDMLPVPLRYVSSDVGAHDGAVVVGRITSITRGQGGKIEAEGDFDLASEVGREAARQVGEGLQAGVSMDLDSVSFEVRVAADLVQGTAPGPDLADPSQVETDSEGRVTVGGMNAGDEVMVTTAARVRAATLVAVPAFAEARIELTGETTTPEAAAVVAAATQAAHDDALVAAAAPMAPPAAWFGDPGLEEVTPITITPEGRIFGHLAAWGTCHTSHTAHGQCVTPPESRSDYAYFRTGAVLTAEGSEVPVGHITLDTRHAGASLTPASTLAHYEETGTVAADVAAGEDAFGIWVSGALRPHLTADQVRALRSSPLSGDWRRIGPALELVAALAVNVPGFPVPRPKGLVAGGVMTSLVASGMVAPKKVLPPGTDGALSLDDLRYLKRLAERERAEENRRAALVASAGADSPADLAETLARRVRAVELAARVRATRS